MTDDYEVRHAADRMRYELWKGDDLIGFSDARVQGDRVIMPHVEIDPAYEGQGLGTRLVKESLDDVRAKGLKVTALCPFVVAFLRRNPDYADLSAG